VWSLSMCGHARAIKFNFMHPLRPGRRFIDGLGKLGRNELRKRNVGPRPTGFEGLRGGTLGDTRHALNPIRQRNSAQPPQRRQGSIKRTAPRLLSLPGDAQGTLSGLSYPHSTEDQYDAA
jgi:hypothetical protein